MTYVWRQAPSGRWHCYRRIDSSVSVCGKALTRSAIDATHELDPNAKRCLNCWRMSQSMLYPTGTEDNP